jgi:transcriptional regulator with XRE-family HTH domain
MEIDKRIVTLIEILGLTPGEFADKINVQRSSISHITSARNKPSLDFLERALSVFPEINSEWLILGKGKPLKTQVEEKKKTNSGTQSPLLFPTDDDLKGTELKPEEKNTISEESIKPENPVKLNSGTMDIFTGNTDTKKNS